MELNIGTIILLSFGIGFFMSFLRSRNRNKAVRDFVAKYINIIKMILTNDKESLSAMEYNDRYTMVFNKGELSKFGMIRLLKGEKKLIILEDIVKLTDQEYEKLLETLKPAL